MRCYPYRPTCPVMNGCVLAWLPKPAGLDFDAFNDWSAGAGNYSEPDARDTWRSFKPGKGGYMVAT
jgi:hypothetical protein